MQAKGAALSGIGQVKRSGRPVRRGREERRPPACSLVWRAISFHWAQPGTRATSVPVSPPHCQSHREVPRTEEQKHQTPVPVLSQLLQPPGGPRTRQARPLSLGDSEGPWAHTQVPPGALCQAAPSASSTPPPLPHPQPVHARLSMGEGRRRWSRMGRGSSWTKAAAATGDPGRRKQQQGQQEGGGRAVLMGCGAQARPWTPRSLRRPREHCLLPSRPPTERLP